MKPVIGITCNYDYKDNIGTVTGLGAPLQDWDYIAMDYANAISRAGGIPVWIPNLEDPKEIEDLIGRLDGVLLSGGSDVDPHIYGEEPSAFCGPVFTRRDRMEMEVLKVAYEKKLPILGICRGLQFMAVSFGGNLYQDLPHELNLYHSSQVYRRNEAAHPVQLTGILKEIFGTEMLGVNSYHHQAVKSIGGRGTVLATSPDGIVEGASFTGGHPFTLGVQWHPEMMHDSREQVKLFDAFVKACSK